MSKLATVEDARLAAKRRMPKMMFDYIDGSAGHELGYSKNLSHIEEIRLQPRVLVNTENRTLKKTLFGTEWDLPLGIAPMGMCNLTWPGADKMLAKAAVDNNIPLCLSTMASSNIEDTFDRAGRNSWFQLYVGASESVALNMVDRAANCGYETLILTVDVPIVAARPREKRNGFQSPIKIGPRQFFDFALHPQWSISTLLNGVPELANNKPVRSSNDQNSASLNKIERNESRGKVDWKFLERLRNHWQGNLVVKGVMHPDDALGVKNSGADAVYVSNHGGRQLDSAPAAIDCLPLIRTVVGDDFTVLFDSGIRTGESVIKALALGADFVFLGRPLLYGIGAAGEVGLNQIFQTIKTDIDASLAQLGKTDINSIDRTILA